MPTEEEMKQMLGAVDSKPDYRYINFETLAGAAPEATAFPRKFHIDYSGVTKANQRKIGSCTTQSAAEIKTHRDLRLGGAPQPRTVARFTYALCKLNDGLPANEQGTYCNMSLKMGVKFGFATEKTVLDDSTLSFEDYIYRRDVKNIPAAAFAEADDRRIPGYAQVGKFYDVSAAQLMQAIMASQDGVKICMRVGREWWTDKNGNFSYKAEDLLPIRPCTDPVSGHDIDATGFEFEDGTDRLKIFFRNHWGEEWGDHGDGWYYFDQHVLSESWVVSEIPDALLAIVKSLPARENFKPLFEKDLEFKASGPDVKNLQIALKVIGTFPFAQPVTDYFGPITQASVMQFQRQYKIATEQEIVAAKGRLGPKSRGIINKLMAQN